MDTLPRRGVSNERDFSSSSLDDDQPRSRDRYHSRRVSKVHDGYRAAVTCPICIDIFIDPHTLGPCGHTACGPCFFSWEGSRMSAPTCPKCCLRVQQVARNSTVQAFVDTVLHSMNKNHEEGWMKGDHNTPMGKDRQAYEERKAAWNELYSQIPRKSLKIAPESILG